MTFLPIVDRELRVASRRRGTYSMRLRVALLAIVIGGCILFANLGAAPAMMGKFLFTGLAVLALVYCLFSGRHSTADCLSEEKREGTLGLLFLTDLKGYDVVLGKMAATSLNAFYGLLALFPVLAIPMLLGGVTNGEFWRTVLVLLNTFLFSLAIGIFSSALSREFRKALALNFVLLIFFTVALPASFLGIMVAQNLPQPMPGFLISSPICTFAAGLDSGYKTFPEVFWWSLALIHGLTWLFVILAIRILPHSWQDQPSSPRRAAKGRNQSFWQGWSYGHPAKRAAFRKKLLDVNAFYWLAARVWLKPLQVWFFFALIGCWWLWGRAESGAIWLDESTNIIMALLLNSTLKLWVALEAGQRLAEDKKIGALELLLSTPLTVRDIMRGQLLALRRQFLKPVIFVIVLELFLMEASMRHGRPYDPEMRSVWLAGVIMLVADLAALSVAGMTHALSCRTHHQALPRTVACILILPWLGFGLVTLIESLWTEFVLGNAWSPDWKFQLGMWFGFGMCADAVFGLLAWRQLQTRMRRYAMQRFDPPRSGNWLARLKNSAPPVSTGRVANPPAAKKWPRKNLLCCAIALVLLLVCASFFIPQSKSKFPPPIMVPVSLKQGPLRVFPNYGGALFILPDGALWGWGESGRNYSSTMPEKFATGGEWLEANYTGDHWAGLRSDGTIWEMYFNSSAMGSSNLTQPVPGHDWVDITGQRVQSFAIKRDGTLWSWSGNSRNSGNAPHSSQTNLVQTNLVQIGTNSDWTTIRGYGNHTLALRADGSLWVMGQIWIQSPTSYTLNNPTPQKLEVPIQVCREMNWVGLDKGNRLVRNRQGELWNLFFAPPGADQGIVVVGRLFYSNSVPDKVAFAYLGDQKVFQVYSDGTLWERNHSYGPTAGESAGKWRQVGARRDWVSLWSGGGTAFGLTRDGTLWTWGHDPNLKPATGFAAGIHLLLQRLRHGTTARGAGESPYQKEPRPLIIFSATNPKPFGQD